MANMADKTTMDKATPNVASGEEAEKKLLWRCRRGTKELDILLGDYLKRRYRCAGAAQQKAFRCLLELPDPDIHDLLTGAATSNDAAMNDVVRSMARAAGPAAAGG